METLMLILFLILNSPNSNEVNESKIEIQEETNATYMLMKKLLNGMKEDEKRKIKLIQYAEAFNKYSKEFKVDLDLILSIGHLESSYRNIQKKEWPHDSGILQIIPSDQHTRAFINKEYGIPKEGYKKWIKKNPIKAIRVGVWELSFFKSEWKRYIRRKCRRYMTERWESVLTPKKKISKNSYKKMNFYWMPFYNWGGNKCLYNSKARVYPFAVISRYKKIQKYKTFQ